jgi:hypothetical protein
MLLYAGRICVTYLAFFYLTVIFSHHCYDTNACSPLLVVAQIIIMFLNKYMFIFQTWYLLLGVSSPRTRSKAVVTLPGCWIPLDDMDVQYLVSSGYGQKTSWQEWSRCSVRTKRA